MKTNVSPQELIGRKVVDTEGNKIGTIGQVYLDDRTGEPEWVTVKTGMFGGRESFVPLGPAEMQQEDVRVPFDKELVKEAPSLGTDEHLSPDEEARLYRHYSVTPGGGMSRTETTAAGTAGTAGVGQQHRPSDARSGLADTGTAARQQKTAAETRSTTRVPETSAREDVSRTRDTAARGAAQRGTADDAMTRSEERIDYHIETVETGRARLRKVIETERVDRVVPVMHETWEVVREPITEANRGDALHGPALNEDQHEITLHEERVIVRKEVVPVERIRLVAKRVQGEHRISEELRRERIELQSGGETQVLDRPNEQPRGRNT